MGTCSKTTIECIGHHDDDVMIRVDDELGRHLITDEDPEFKALVKEIDAFATKIRKADRKRWEILKANLPADNPERF